MDLFFVFVIAMSVAMLLVPLLARGAERFHVLDLPSPRKVHTTPVPRIGGIAMVVGTALPLVVWLRFTPALEAFLLAAAVLLVFGIWDDRVDLDYRVKLLGQVIAIGIVMFYGDVRVESLTLGARDPIPEWISLPLTFLFLLGVTNAINLADGLDGLAGGTALMCSCAIALLAYSGDDLLVATMAVGIVGAILGFLRYNTYPARIFMGDGGSQFLGLGIGVLAVMATQNPAVPFSAALPILLLGLPILDTLMVMTQRIADGRSPFAADRNHVHHKLLELGFDHHEAVVAIYLLQGVLFLLAYFLRYESDALIVASFAGFALVVIAFLQWARATGWRWRAPRAAQQGSALTRRIQWLRAPDRLPRWALIFICCVLPLYCVLVIARSTPVSSDLAWLALALLGSLIGALLWRGRDPGWIEKIVMYVAAVLIVYLDETSGALRGMLGLVPFAVLAAAVLVRFRLSSDRRFAVTPLDVLVTFVALVIPNLPGSVALPPGLATGIAKLFVLFYAIESLLSGRVQWVVSRALVALTLGVLAVRGLLPVM